MEIMSLTSLSLKIFFKIYEVNKIQPKTKIPNII